MAKSDPNALSSAIDSGDGRLEIKNDHALIQIERALTSGANMNAQLLAQIRQWILTEKRLNKEAKGGYMISWKKLESLLKNQDDMRSLLLKNCEAFRVYVEGVESGEIVPTPTPPPSVVVEREQGSVRKGVAALYGRSVSSKPPKTA